MSARHPEAKFTTSAFGGASPVRDVHVLSDLPLSVSQTLKCLPPSLMPFIPRQFSHVRHNPDRGIMTVMPISA